MAGIAFITAIVVAVFWKAIAIPGVLVLGVVLAWIQWRRFPAWGYAERKDDLLVRRGVLFSRLSVIPYGRMQYIDVTAGPLERAFGLATVHMHTAAAASDARIPGLDREDAATAPRPAGRARRGAGGRAVSEHADGWQRLHPLSPIVRGGRATIAIAIVARARRCSARRTSVETRTRRSGSSRCSSLLGFVSWLVTRWRIEGDDLRIETGLSGGGRCASRSSQVQAIDIVRPGLARMFRVAELRLRMGGSSGNTARLAYLPEREVEPLRDAAARARARRARRRRRAGRRAEPPEERVLTTVPTGPPRRVDPGQRRRPLRRGGARRAVVTCVLSPARRRRAIVGGGLVWIIGVCHARLAALQPGVPADGGRGPDGLRLHSAA